MKPTRRPSQASVLCVSHTVQSALESCQEARISTAFDRVNHQGSLYKLFSLGTEGVVLATVVGVKWLTLCQECRMAVFGPVIVPSVHLSAFLYSGVC